MDEKSARFELEYWRQILLDCRETVDSLDKINDENTTVIDLAAQLLPFALVSEPIMAIGEKLLEHVEKIQDLLIPSIKRIDSIGSLVEGRMSVIKEELHGAG